VKYKLLIEKYLNKILRKVAKGSTLNIFTKNYFWKNLEEFEFFYNKLEDERSKKLYVEIIVYKMLGFHKVKLSLNNQKFWDMRHDAELYKADKHIPVNFRDGRLYLYQVQDIGFDVNLYFVNNGIVTDFMLEQYNYENIVKVKEDDIVIDCGGCWGDTALYFASLGAKKVYVYEFIPSNIAILQENIKLNEKYKDVITLVNNPVWNRSGEKLSYYDDGPSSQVGDYEKYDKKTETLSIDDLVNRGQLESVDFIKMDIEGAEVPALNGAIDTIKKYKPKLAISVYHKEDDLSKIPKLINNIRDDYRFYFDYYTIIGDEAMLYAI
jgi:FkbM family methyltransferase